VVAPVAPSRLSGEVHRGPAEGRMRAKAHALADARAPRWTLGLKGLRRHRGYDFARCAAPCNFQWTYCKMCPVRSIIAEVRLQVVFSGR